MTSKKQLKQSLSNWQAGFASAAVTVITAFFAGDPEFAGEGTWQAFTEAMLVKNRFLQYSVIIRESTIRLVILVLCLC